MTLVFSCITLALRFASTLDLDSNMSTDPRDSTRETKLSLPKTWHAESAGKYSAFVRLYRTHSESLDRHHGLDGHVPRRLGAGF